MHPLLLLLLLLLPLVGCFEVEHHFTMNPDGSGKVKIESSTESALDASDSDLGRRIRKIVLASIDSTKGVDAWRDVSYSYNNGRFHFKGTAYFSDITRLEGGSLSLLRFRLARTPTGARMVYMLMEAKPGFSFSLLDTATLVPSPSSLEEQIDSARRSLSMVRHMMRSSLSGLRMRTEFTMPPALPDARGLSENLHICAMNLNRRGNWEVELTGAHILDALDSLMSDRDLLLRQINQPADSSGAVMQQLLVPSCGMPSFRLPGRGRALFDYRKEVAAARREHRKIMRTLQR